MSEHRFIKAGSAKIEALDMQLGSRHLIVLKGSKGYIMCGYLNQSVAAGFGDAAIKIKGVSSIRDALRATVFSCTSSARKLGVRAGQPVKEAVRLIA